MRDILWTDKHGQIHRSLVRDGDSDDMAQYGIPREPPDLDLIDWEMVKNDIRNRLVEANLITWGDVQKMQNGVSGVILGALKNKIINLYRTDSRR